MHNSQFTSVETYIDRALASYEFAAKGNGFQLQTSELSSSSVRSKVAALWALHASARRLAELFTGLQTMVQPITEQLVICDRSRYLEEMGVENVFCDVVKILDESISPRCIAITSKKLS